MREYWIDFNGYLKVKANSETEAERKLWDFFCTISTPDDFSNEVFDVEGIEEVKENKNADY